MSTRHDTEPQPCLDPEGGPCWDAQVGAIAVRFGAGRLTEVAEIVREMGCRRPFVVSDPGLAAAGHLDTLECTLAAADLPVGLFAEVGSNPTAAQVEAGCRAATLHRPDCIVSLGGGSAMDCGKGINLLLTNGGTIFDYWGYGKATTPLLPSIGIPTTAGTGSEAQSFALISDPKTHRKMACGDPRLAFRAVILDPDLLASVPAPVATAAGLDAVAHAIESYVSRRSNPVARLLARCAWQLLEAHLEPALKPHESQRHHPDMMLAAHFAGAAIEQSMLGAAHACANPLTAAFDIVHGEAVALMLPAVIRFNAVVIDEGYSELAGAVGLTPKAGGGDDLAARIESMRSRLGQPRGLAELGVSKADLPSLAAAAAAEWTAQFNPRSCGTQDLEALYHAAL